MKIFFFCMNWRSQDFCSVTPISFLVSHVRKLVSSVDFGAWPDGSYGESDEIANEENNCNKASQDAAEMENESSPVAITVQMKVAETMENLRPDQAQ